MLRLRLAALAIAAILVSSSRAGAVGLDPTSFIQATDTIIADLVTWVGLGFDLHAYESVKPYSSVWGLDFGPSATAIMLPGAVVKGLTDLGVSNVPHYAPAPKINIQKAINKRLLIGSEFLPTIKIAHRTINLYGFDIQYAFLERPRLPVFSLRAQYNYVNFAFMHATTYGGDVLTSIPVLFLDFFGGGGYRYVTGGLANPTATIPNVPGLKLDATTDAGHFFGGVTIALGFFRLTAQADYTTRNVNSYGSKLSFFF